MPFLYCFESFPDKEILEKKFRSIFIVTSPKIDSEIIVEKFLSSDKNSLIGIAKAPGKTSFIESRAVNLFNGKSSVLKRTPEEYIMDIPDKKYSIRVREGYTDSFCNYVMYRVAHGLRDIKDKKHYFFHVNIDELQKVSEIIEALSY